MSVILNNRKDIVANSIAADKVNKTIGLVENIDVFQGLAPETLNCLEKLTTTLNNDSNF